MRGISEERLRKIARETHDSDDTNMIVLSVFDMLIGECKELNAWKPIDGNTPKDRLILVYAPCCDGLGDLITTCLWHDDAGFCIDMIREPTHWADLPTLPKAKL